VRKLANQAKPVKTMAGPSRLPGRWRHRIRPLPMNDQPTRSAIGAFAVWYGWVVRSAASQAAPAPDPSAASASAHSRALTPSMLNL
jgi:hypothetical protein